MAIANPARLAPATASDGPPVNSGLPSISDMQGHDPPQLGDTLSASTGTWSDSPTYTYQWRRCNSTGGSCSSISGATSATYKLVSTDVGKALSVVVTATNGFGAASATSAATAAVVGPPKNATLPTIGDTQHNPPQLSDMLTASKGSWSGDPTGTTYQYAYQWRRCTSTGGNCGNISGETNASYTLVPADVGLTVRVVVTATNSYGSSSASSAATAAVLGAPTNTFLPAISDDAGNNPPQLGDTLRAWNGSWNAKPAPSYTYQWRRCDSTGASCGDIPFETGPTHTVGINDLPSSTIRVLVTATNSVGSSGATSAQTGVVGGSLATSPIRHVVVIYQENHSFDNVLGRYCVQNARCDGATIGMLSTGAPIALGTATDVVPSVDHGVNSQTNSAHLGLMDHFDQLGGCRSTDAHPYACFTQFNPTQIPNVASLATTFALSDRTFEEDLAPSFGAHLELVSATLDGFYGENASTAPDHNPGPGWGCDSFKVALWRASPSDPLIKVPSCIPRQDGFGPYKTSPVQWVPTIMDRLDERGLSWRIYATGEPSTAPSGNLPYGWAICPTFADCLYTSQVSNMVDSSQIITDAKNGTLPNLALLMPALANSQHNSDSMLQGDKWIGSVVSAIRQSDQWNSTAIFITWDDCGCFYDHVPPPAGLGIRVPMVIVSPYVRAGYTDSNLASFASMLAFTEHTFGIAPLAAADATAYDYSNSFDYNQQPLTTAFTAVRRQLPVQERIWLREHPPPPDDPT